MATARYSVAVPAASAFRGCRNVFCCARLRVVVPVATALKVEALARDFRSQRRLADALGVSPAQISRWKQGRGIDPDNAERLDLLELVMSFLLRLYEPATADKWLFGVNPLLRDRRPIDVVRSGEAEQLLAALRQERADSFA
jgi:uncharacterized protein (DUF2384 family)